MVVQKLYVKSLKRKKISSDNYTYATFAPKTNKWSLSNDKVKSAKLLLEKTWVENNIPSFGNNDIKLDLEMVPPILELKDEEKFKDDKGNIIEIETRGTKTLDGIYFYGKDVEKILELKCITDILNNPETNYKINIHYKIFIRDEINVTSPNNKKSNKQTIYLTGLGLIKFLQSTRKNVPIYFINWLNDLLGIQFTHIKFLTPETDTIYSIQKSIYTDSIPQFTVDKYRIDLYLPEYNIAIECDENNHNGRYMYYEKDRENYIKEKLKCSFIRYDPYAKDFDIFKVIEKINKFIKQTTIEKNLNKEIEFQKLNNENELIRQELEKQQIIHECKLKELELKLKHEQELKNIEKQSKDEILKILTNLSIHFNKN